MNDGVTPIQRVRELIASNAGNSNSIDLGAIRAGMASFPENNPPANDVEFQELEVAGRPALEIRTPGSANDRVIFHIHGGGLVAGSPASHRSMLGELSRSAKATIIALDYRLAPEHPYPAAIEDVVAGYDTLTDKYGRLVVSGDSAGAGLALALLSRSANLDGNRAIAGVLLSPWADFSLTAPSLQDLAGRDPVVKLDTIRWMANAYAGDKELTDPSVSPLFADLRGLSPILLQVGSNEILLDDALAIDRKVRAGGGDVTLEVWPEMIHGWHLWTSFLPEAQQAIRRAGFFINKRFDTLRNNQP